MDEILETRQGLLRRTLSHACRSFFHRERINEVIDVKSATLLDLKKLPTMDKKVLSERCVDLFTSKIFPARIGFSSGTSGQLTIQCSSYEELDALQWIKRQLASHAGLSKDHLPISIKMSSNMHGRSLPLEDQNVIEIPLELPFHFDHYVRILSNLDRLPFVNDGVKFLIGSTGRLKTLSSLLKRAGHDPEQFTLQTVFASTDRLTPRWKKEIEETTGAEVTTIYGLSEISVSISPECTICGGYRLSPFVISEILHFDDDGDTETGELTLTPLYPFNSYQPLIRYRTGDIVQKKDCEGENNCIEFLGRRLQSIIDKEKLLLPGAIVMDILDDFIGVFRPHDRLAREFNLEMPTGNPHFVVGFDPPTKSVKLKVSTNYSSDTSPQEIEKLRNSIKQSFVRRNIMIRGYDYQINF